MGRPKIYTDEERKIRSRSASLKWIKKNKEKSSLNNKIWAEKNKDRIIISVRKSYNKFKYDHRRRASRLWETIKSRCYNVNNKGYSRYGGRGIKMCDLWLNDRNSFIEWVLNSGYEVGLMIERINNDGNYEPSNCKFANSKEQNNNRCSNVFIEYNGERKTLAQWSEYFGICKATLWRRYNRRLSIEEIFSTSHLHSNKSIQKDKYFN